MSKTRNAGKYNRRIQVYQVTKGKDAAGFPADVEALVLTAYAEVKTTKGFTLIMNNNLDKDVFLERSASLLKKYSIRFIHKNGEKCILEEENYLRCRKYAVELEEVSEIIIDIAETYGEDVSLYGVSIK